MIKCHRSTFPGMLRCEERGESLDTIGKRTIPGETKKKGNKSRSRSNLSYIECENDIIICDGFTMSYCFFVFLFFFYFFLDIWRINQEEAICK